MSNRNLLFTIEKRHIWSNFCEHALVTNNWIVESTSTLLLFPRPNMQATIIMIKTVNLILFYIQPQVYRTVMPLFFISWELVSRRVSNDLLDLLFRALPASFNNSSNLRLSSSTSGFAVPSFSSLMPTTYSKISMASSTLQNITNEQEMLATITSKLRILVMHGVVNKRNEESNSDN